jgi:chromosome segregation ATPase
MINRFSTVRDEEFQQEITSFKEKTRLLEEELSKWKEEKQELQKEILNLNHQLSNAVNEKQILDGKYLDLLHQKEDLELKISEISNSNGLPKEDIEEALMLLRLKRESGVSFEYLSGLKLMHEENRSIKELRLEYVECIQELEKTKSMLQIQKVINEKHLEKMQMVESNSRRLQHEYELRIEEYVRLTDIRKHKIEKLQQQLRNIGVSEGNLI